MNESTKSKQSNGWLDGYNAAMRAERPADFEQWFAKSREGTKFEAWITGWHSVWKCERRDEGK